MTPEVIQFSRAKDRSQVENWVRRNVIRPWVKATGTGRSRNYNFLNLVEAAMAVALSRLGIPSAIIASATDDFRVFNHEYARGMLRIQDAATGLWRPMTAVEYDATMAPLPPVEFRSVEAEAARAEARRQGAGLRAALKKPLTDEELARAREALGHVNQRLNQWARWEIFKNPDTRDEQHSTWIFYLATEGDEHHGGWQMLEGSDGLATELLTADGAVVALPMHKIIIDLEEATGDHMLDPGETADEHVDAQEALRENDK